MEELFKLAINDDDDIYTEIVKKNINERKIILNQEVTDGLLERICMYILLWNKEDTNIPVDKRKKIYIYISTDGGDVIMGMNILDVIASSKTPIVTVGFSKCASMGSYILASGHERICFPNTVVLLHDGQTGYMASGNKGKDIQNFYDRLDERTSRFMIEHTKMTAEYLESIKDRETYLFADQAKEFGIIDKIIGIDCELSEIL